MKNNDHIAPFFAQPVNLKVGLNHLGYRNAAEDLFTTLLPGLNNVTARIRYYSFYCWLIDKFFQNKPEPTVGEYNAFVRTAEYLLAILHAGLKDSGGIPGIDYAIDTMESDPDIVDLHSGTSPANGTSTRGTFWANPGGVLRQYYGNSLQDMGITVPSLKISGISDISKQGDHITGKDLSEYFEESIGSNASALFLNCIRKEKISREERDILRPPFSMKNVPGSIGEREMLIQMLLQEDYPGRSSRQLRRDTIRYYLEYCSDPLIKSYNDELGFPRYLYKRYLKGERDSSCITGWYCFYLDDAWQYYASVILERVLDILRKDKFGKWVNLNDFTDEIASAVTTKFNADDTSLESVISNQQDISGKDNIGRISKAMSALFDYYIINNAIWPDSSFLKVELGYYGTDDFHSASEYINKGKHMIFKDFVKQFIESKIIFRHYNISLRKYYQTGIASHKFMIEDGHIRYLKDTFTQATHTSPRLVSLIAFLSDLDLVHDLTLTEKGKELLKKLS